MIKWETYHTPEKDVEIDVNDKRIRKIWLTCNSQYNKIKQSTIFPTKCPRVPDKWKEHNRTTVFEYTGVQNKLGWEYEMFRWNAQKNHNYNSYHFP